MGLKGIVALFIEGKESLFFIANNYYESLMFELPKVEGKWKCLINTAHLKQVEEVVESEQYEVKAYSVCLFQISL